MSGLSPRFCVSSQAFRHCCCFGIMPYTWRAGFSLKPYVVRWQMGVLRREAAPSTHSFPTPEPCEWVTNKAVNMLISPDPGLGAASWVTPLYQTRHCLPCAGVGTFKRLHCRNWGRPLYQLSEVWTLGRAGRGQMEVEGPVVVALETTEGSMGRILFCLDLTLQSSHSDSLRSCVFSVLHWFPLRWQAVSPSPPPASLLLNL